MEKGNAEVQFFSRIIEIENANILVCYGLLIFMDKALLRSRKTN